VETRSSTDHAPRFRLVFPLTGKLDHEEYNAASRVLGSLLFDDEEESMRAVDDVSYRFAQLMFLPTASKGQKLQIVHNEGKLLDAKALLKSWSKKHDLDWRDHANLPFNPDRGNKAPTAPGTTQEDPWEKQGIIGAFCRAYPIEDAMATFLPGVYEEAATPSALPRYTFTQGGGSMHKRLPHPKRHQRAVPSCLRKWPRSIRWRFCGMHLSPHLWRQLLSRA
ncbi:hypothetical protein, partial [Tateyamaria sp.]